jgi:hypothetical protein
LAAMADSIALAVASDKLIQCARRQRARIEKITLFVTLLSARERERTIKIALTLFCSTSIIMRCMYVFVVLFSDLRIIWPQVGYISLAKHVG